MVNWILKCDIATILDSDDDLGSAAIMERADKAGKKLLAFSETASAAIRLEAHDLSQLAYLSEALVESCDVDDAEFNLESIYDWADANLVWLGN